MTARRALMAGLVLAAAGSPAFAHTGGSTGYAVIAVDRANVRYSLTLWPTAMPPAVAAELRLAGAGHTQSRDRVLGVIRDQVRLVAQGTRCQAGAGSVREPPPAADSVTLTVDFVCAETVRDLVIRDDLFDVFGPDHHTLARLDAPGRTEQFVFTPETRETRFRLDGLAADGRGTASFVRLGVAHILSGYDHLLFLFGLLLPGGGLVAMAKIVTAFTVAHSVTLSLAVLDLVRLADRLVEAVIGLSIAAVAAENLWLRPTVTRRWIVSFAFGLVHGFGFSSALRELGLPAHGLVLSLLGFNLGVELGQALVVAVALPALALLRGTAWNRHVAWGSSMAILLVGVVLFVERALL